MPARVAATLGMAAGLVVVAGPSVTHESTRSVEHGEAGGTSGTVRLGNVEEPSHVLVFRASGEHLWLHDRDHDGRDAEAKVVITRPDGTLAGFIQVSTRDGSHFELGVPDGSDDIPEGHRVWVSMRPTGSDWSEAVEFTA